MYVSSIVTVVISLCSLFISIRVQHFCGFVFCPIKSPVIQTIKYFPYYKSVESVTRMMTLYSKQIHVCIALYVAINQ